MGLLAFAGAAWNVAPAGAQRSPSRLVDATAPAPSQAGCSWTGLWDSGLYGQISLVQTGTRVAGSYAFYPSPGAQLIQGQITATASGVSLNGTWAQAPTYTGQDAGAFSFTMASSCNAFTGQWRLTTTPLGYWDGAWTGTRMQ